MHIVEDNQFIAIIHVLEKAYLERTAQTSNETYFSVEYKESKKETVFA